MRTYLRKLSFLVFLLLATTNAFAGEFKPISHNEAVWWNGGKPAATVTKTSAGNWKIKRSDGYYIALITKRGDIQLRDNGLTISDMDIVVGVQKALVSQN